MRVSSPLSWQVAVLDEAVEKLTFLGSITPDVLQHRDELSKFVGDEISRIIVEQRHLEARYEELIAERGTLKGLANKARYKEVQQEIAEVSRSLRESTKHLCRNLKDNPNISGNLIKIQRERADLIEVTRCFGCFGCFGLFCPLLLPPPRHAGLSWLSSRAISAGPRRAKNEGASCPRSLASV